MHADCWDAPFGLMPGLHMQSQHSILLLQHSLHAAPTVAYTWLGCVAARARRVSVQQLTEREDMQESIKHMDRESRTTQRCLTALNKVILALPCRLVLHPAMCEHLLPCWAAEFGHTAANICSGPTPRAPLLANSVPAAARQCCSRDLSSKSCRAVCQTSSYAVMEGGMLQAKPRWLCLPMIGPCKSLM